MDEALFKDAVAYLGAKLEQLIDINMMMLQALDPDLCETVDIVHNDLGMLLTDDGWKEKLKELDERD